MNSDYKKGTLMAAITGIFSFGIGIYFLTKDFKTAAGFYKFTTIATIVSLVMLVIFAFAKLNKVSIGCLFAAFLFSSIRFLKYMDYYSSAMEYLFKGGKNRRVDETLYVANIAVEPYFSFLLTILTLILFILCFTTPNRGGIVNSIIIFETFSTLFSIAGTVGYISGKAEFAEYIKDFWLDNVLRLVEAITSLLMVIGITSSVKADDPREVRAGKTIPQGGMYGIPYSERPRQNVQFGYGTGTNLYNTPQNPNYFQQGSYNQMGMYGQMQGGYGQPQNNYGQPNMNYNQPQNMGGYGPGNNGYGQPDNRYGQPQNAGGYSQSQNNYGQQNNQNGFNGTDANNRQNMNEFGQNQKSAAPSIGDIDIPGTADNINDSTAKELSLYDKPDNL